MALPKLNIFIKRNKAAFVLGAQGPDPFFYYNLQVGRFGSDMASEARRLHSRDTGKTFAAMLRYAGNDDVLLSYVAGWICHYVLDATAHPYVYWMSGCTLSRLRKPRYSLYHQRFEADLDMALWDEAVMPRDWTWFQMPAEKRLRISRMMAEVCGLDEEKVDRAYRHFARTRRRLYDGKGSKYRRALMLEQVFGMTDMLSAALYQRDTVDYTLNLGKEAWALPWEPGFLRYESYPELMDIAHDWGYALLNALCDYAKGGLRADALIAMYGNVSYYTGLDCGCAALMYAHDCIYERAEIRGLRGLRLAYGENG